MHDKQLCRNSTQRPGDSDAQDAAMSLLVTEVADSTALRSSARRTERDDSSSAKVDGA